MLENALATPCIAMILWSIPRHRCSNYSSLLVGPCTGDRLDDAPYLVIEQIEVGCSVATDPVERLHLFQIWEKFGLLNFLHYIVWQCA